MDTVQIKQVLLLLAKQSYRNHRYQLAEQILFHAQEFRDVPHVLTTWEYRLRPTAISNEPLKHPMVLTESDSSSASSSTAVQPAPTLWQRRQKKQNEGAKQEIKKLKI